MVPYGSARRMQRGAVATELPLDVALTGSGLEDEFLNRVKPTEVGGATIPLIDLADLIAKILAGRPKDIDDARNL